MPRFIFTLAVLGFFSLATPLSFAQKTLTNLHVLPKDISEDELSASMLENLRGLGLRRRQNEGCLHCHVGDMEQPSDSWDWASDAKPAKGKARTMMAMVRDINAQHLEKLEPRLDPPMRVTCYTCHAGRIDPRPLPDVLAAAYGDGGIESAMARYRELHERYFGGDAYDFRVGVLAGVAFEMAGRGAFDDAVALAELNTEVHPTEPAARRIWLQLRLGRTHAESGNTAALSEFDGWLRGPESEAIDPALLDGVGWGLFRRDRQDDALAVFRRNHQQFPEEYIPNESLADALWNHGERDQAIEMFEAWLARHPDHAMARRRLATLKRQL
ncbi:MAG: c-type cytochrome [Acidobacteria bacterium]|nr:MAG: c-type cytochrome [Acidobacteriota bacterium]